MNEKYKHLLIGLTSDHYIKVHKQIKALREEKSDGRKNQITKQEFIIYLDALKYCEYTYESFEITDQETKDLITAIEMYLNDNLYPRLKKNRRRQFLHHIDNALILIFMDEFGKYPMKQGLINIQQMPQPFLQNLTNKLNRLRYTLPKYLQPMRVD